MQMPDGTLIEKTRGTMQGGLCKALHKDPYAKKVIMQSNPASNEYFQQIHQILLCIISKQNHFMLKNTQVIIIRYHLVIYIFIN
jgi:hypothetical protein